MKAINLLYSYKNMRVLQGSDKRDCILTEIDEAIAELEALQQRSCESCRHWDFNEQGHFKKCFNGKGNVLSTKGDFCCNRYEAKENK